jgi:hypothetical protein
VAPALDTLLAVAEIGGFAVDVGLRDRLARQR